MTNRVAYRYLMSDNLRWDALALRDGDIVISSPSKCGMTWTQRLVSLLVFDGPDLPGPLSTVSPWLDQTIRPIEEVVRQLDAQGHRRFIKTHTPLDGLVFDDRVTYIGVGRDPRDAAVSALFQEANVNKERMRALRVAAMPPSQAPMPPHQAAMPPHERFGRPGADGARAPSPREMFRDWMDQPMMPPEGMGSLATVLHHFNTMWHWRHLPNVALFHYTDLQTDLVGEIVRLGQVLGYHVGRDRAEDLARHASLDAMRAHASQFAPNTTEGLWHSNERFFRAGGVGEWQRFLTEDELRRYVHRADQLAPRDVLAWAHVGRRACDPAR